MKNKQNYHADWSDIIRPAILKRDGYKCTKCNIKHKGFISKIGSKTEHVIDDFEAAWLRSKGHVVAKVYLQVCHLDQNPANNEYSNLVSMCPACHLRYDNQYNVIKRMLKRNNVATEPKSIKSILESETVKAERTSNWFIISPKTQN